MRKQRGLSQEKLAQEANMERNYVSLLERGCNSPSVKKIFSLARALEISVAEFMGMVESKANEPNKVRPIGSKNHKEVA